MPRKVFYALLGGLFLASLAGYLYTMPRHTGLILIGEIDAHEVIVSPQITGRIVQLTVDEGSEVDVGDLLAQLDAAELEAQSARVAASVRSLEARITEIKTQIAWTDASTAAALDNARATLASTRAQLAEAQAERRRARLDYDRAQQLFEQGVVAEQARDHAEADFKAAAARVASLTDQIKAAQSALTAAQADRQQVDVRRAELASTRAQLTEARAEHTEAETRLGYATVRAPIAGVVSIRAARAGEVVQVGQPIVTLIDLDHLWVRAVIPETYVNRIRLGDRFPVRLPDGQSVEGEVFYRGAESEFATQRDVSRTKRDIKAFALKLSIPNPDRRLYAGMTAEVLLPFED